MIANPNDGNTPKVEQAVPKISVSAAGLITATAEQQKGYVPGGTKSTTHQLTTQGAKTVTPGRTAHPPWLPGTTPPAKCRWRETLTSWRRISLRV